MPHPGGPGLQSDRCADPDTLPAPSVVTALDMAVTLLGATAKKSTSSNPALLIFVVIAAGFYFLIYRPQQRKAKALRSQSKGFDVGDEVLTAGGIVGHIIDIDGDRVTLETSVGASFVVLKQYVLRKLEEPVPSETDEDEEYEEYEEYEETDDFADHGEQAEGSTDDEDEEDEAEADGPSSSGDHVANGKGDPSGSKGGPSGSSTKADGDDSGGPDRPSAT